MPERFAESSDSLRSVTDEEAMSRVRAGDPRMFGLLAERWHGPIRRLCFRMIGDWQEAEDLAQEAFTRLFETRKNYRPAAKFSTYLWRISLNLCHDYRRRNRRQNNVSASENGHLEPATEESPASVAERNDTARQVRDALDQLPEIYRGVLVLRHYENLKLREVAEILEIPEGTVSSRMAEALRRLSRLLPDTPATGAETPNRSSRELHHRQTGGES